MISPLRSPSLPVLSPTTPPSAASADGVAGVRALRGDDAGDRLEHALRLVGP
jgi:hypothetical protein